MIEDKEPSYQESILKDRRNWYLKNVLLRVVISKWHNGKFVLPSPNLASSCCTKTICPWTARLWSYWTTHQIIFSYCQKEYSRQVSIMYIWSIFTWVWIPTLATYQPEQVIELLSTLDSPLWNNSQVLPGWLQRTSWRKPPSAVPASWWPQL